VTEALNAAGEEFGEERLVELVRPTWRSSDLALEQVLQTVRAHSGDAQYDDITLILAQGR
jgi:serine phosphatase RsbU (regulator of sigma subunit)